LFTFVAFIAVLFPNGHSAIATLYRANASSACVHCAFNAGGCRSCTGGGNALYCETFNCSVCSEEGECVNGGGQKEPDGPKDEPKGSESKNRNEKENRNESQNKNSTKNDNKNSSPKKDTSRNTSLQMMDGIEPQSNKFRIDSSTIKRIANKHPRFAATLAFLGRAKSHSRSCVVHWTPVEIDSGQIDGLLNSRENDTYSKELEEKAHGLNRLIQAGRLEEIVYYVTSENPTPYVQVIRLKLEQENMAAAIDPAYSFLEIRTTYTKNALGAFIKEVNTQWRKSRPLNAFHILSTR